MSVLFDLLADFWGDIADWLIERFTGKKRILVLFEWLLDEL